MPLQSEQQGNNLYHQFSGIVEPADFNQDLNYNKEHYSKIGDGLGVIIDMSRVKRISLATLRHIGSKMRRVHLPNIPVAIIRNKDNLIFTLGMSIAKMSGVGTQQLAFFDDNNSAFAWINSWFTKYPDGRDSVVGQVNPKSFTQK